MPISVHGPNATVTVQEYHDSGSQYIIQGTGPGNYSLCLLLVGIRDLINVNSGYLADRIRLCTPALHQPSIHGSRNVPRKTARIFQIAD